MNHEFENLRILRVSQSGITLYKCTMTIIASTVKFVIMAYSANTRLDSLESRTTDNGDLYEQERLKSSTTDPQPQDASEYALIILSAVLFGLGFLVSSATAPLSSNSNMYVS